MWLFTTQGFYSVVTAEEFGEELQVRARAASDLDRLRESFLPTLGPNVSLPERDYPWRDWIPPDPSPRRRRSSCHHVDRFTVCCGRSVSCGRCECHPVSQVGLDGFRRTGLSRTWRLSLCYLDRDQHLLCRPGNRRRPRVRWRCFGRICGSNSQLADDPNPNRLKHKLPRRIGP